MNGVMVRQLILINQSLGMLQNMLLSLSSKKEQSKAAPKSVVLNLHIAYVALTTHLLSLLYCILTINYYSYESGLQRLLYFLPEDNSKVV